MKHAYLSTAFAIASLIAVSAALAQSPGDSFLWEFNEGGGLTVTDTSGSFPASLGVVLDPAQVPVSLADSPSGAAGDRSIDPNGGLIVDDSAENLLAIEAGPITMEAWHRLDGFDSYADIARYGNAYKLGFTNNANYVFTFLGIEDVDSGVVADVDGVWKHIAAVWEPGVGVTFYLNGEEISFVATTNGNRALQNNNLNIGTDSGGTSSLLGAIDRLRIHNAMLEASELDTNAASPAAPLASTIVSYGFDESGEPYANGAGAKLPAVSRILLDSSQSVPEFIADSPMGADGDFSLQFDGNDQVIFVDDQDILNFDLEDFSLEAWVKFDPAAQVVNRPVLISYGVGGQNGYSFSISAGGVSPTSADDSPSGAAGDRSVNPEGGILVDDTDSPQFAIQDGPVTIEAWVKLDAYDTYTDIARYAGTYKAGFGPDRELLFTMLAVEDVYASDAQAPLDSDWHHYAYAWEPGVGVTFYLDGVEVGFTGTTNANRALQSNTLSIGASASGSSPILGKIDRVRIHNAVLSASELDSAAASVAAPLATTVAAYNFDEAAPPYANAVSGDRPATGRDSKIVVTTFGIVDMFSNVSIPGDKKWHHIAAVHQDQQEFRFYIDGKLGQTIPYVDSVRFAEVFEYFIGSERNRGNPYVGLLDRVKITRGALTESGLDYFEPQAVGEWSLF